MRNNVRDTIVKAAVNRELLMMEYVDRQGVASSREVEPYELRSSSTGELLVAYDRGRKDYRSFRMDGIRSARRTGIRFEPRREIAIAA